MSVQGRPKGQNKLCSAWGWGKVPGTDQPGFESSVFGSRHPRTSGARVVCLGLPVAYSPVPVALLPPGGCGRSLDGGAVLWGQSRATVKLAANTKTTTTTHPLESQRSSAN